MEHQHLLWFVAAVFLLAGAVKGLSGMGLPTFSVALLGLVMPPAMAASLMLLPSLLTNLAQCTGPHTRVLLQRLWPLWLGLALATVGSPLPDLGQAGPGARLALGTVLMVYGVWGWMRPALPDLSRHAPWWGGVAGILTGVVTAATGVFVMPLVPFLQSLRLEKQAFVQALGLSFLVATLALAARLGHTSVDVTFDTRTLAAHALALLAALAGLWWGARWRERLPQARFQRALHAVFMALGALMLARAW